MRKLIPFVVALAIVSCAKDSKTAETSIISGTVTGVTDGKIILEGNSFQEEITLNQDGTFTDTLVLPYAGTYQIQGLNQSIYLEPGHSLNFVLDFQNPEVVAFTGDLGAENEYMFVKQKNRNDVLGTKLKDLYSLSEEAFVEKTKELSKRNEHLLKAYRFKSKKFNDFENKNIKYEKAYLLETFPIYHGYMIEDESFTVSDSYPKTDKALNYDNADDYNFSPSYRELVQLNFDKSIQEDVDKGEDYDDVLIRKLKGIKSENIKNNLVERASYSVSLTSNDFDRLYKEFMSLSTDENFKKDLTEKYNKLQVVVKGKPSPKFNFENHKGGKTSLDDLKGKYVYVDVWATWCGPCVGEIPALKKLEEKYRGKNIEFVSISIDEAKDHDKWKKFVTDKQMGGIQLYADNAWKSQFVQDYVIEGIPRFILIDPNGNIVSADAPRPSDEEIIKLFDELKI